MTAKKTILIFSHNYHPNIGGAEIAIRELTDRIVDFEFVMLTALRDRTQPRHERLGNVQVYRIGFGFDQLDQYLYPFIAPFKALKLDREMRRKNEETNNDQASRHLAGRGRYGGIDATWAMMASQAGMAAAAFKFLRWRIPYLLTDQSGDSDFFWGARTFFWRPIFQQIFKRADRIQVISKFLADNARRMGYKGEIDLVPNGVDLDRFTVKPGAEMWHQQRLELGIREGDKVLITTSRLVVKNAIEVVINALARLKKETQEKPLKERSSYKFIVIGSGDFEGSLKQIARILKVDDQIIFMGDVNNELVPRYLSLADVFVRPSRSEGQGISFIEAMAVGIPVIATPVGGIPDFLEDGETGLFTQVDDVEDLAGKIKLITSDVKLREQIVVKARALVREKYDWDKLALEMEKVFNKLTHGKKE